MPNLQNRVYEENAHRFAPAAPDEEYVYGACAPGWHTAADHEDAIDDWLSYVRRHGVERVCCLIPGEKLDVCGGNVRRYRKAFGTENVCHAPIPDHQLSELSTLRDDIMPFFEASVEQDAPVVAHSLAGIGRTGQVLAAWLVYDRSYTPARAVRTVENMGRLPDEPVRAGNATEDDLIELLEPLR